MSAYAMVRVLVASKNDTQMNGALGLDVPAEALTSTAVSSPNTHEGIQKLIVLLQGILAGSIDATVEVAVRATTQSCTVDGNGHSATYEMK